ncbi:putative methyltransferase DDB_G0268948 [Glandiceps talaboti]
MASTTPQDAFTGFFEGADMVNAYKNVRPTYPQELAQKIVSFAKQKLGDLKFAVDVGCGSGQSTLILADHVDQVLGVDISADQIECAKNSSTPPNVNFKVGGCGDIPVQSGTVDLITVGMAIHWFNLDDFYNEVDRVLRPGGCLAIYVYNGTQIQHDDNEKKKTINNLIQEFEDKVTDICTPESHWKKIYDGENTLQALELAYKDSARDSSLSIKSQRSVASLVALIKSYSSFKEFLRKNPDGNKIFVELQDKIMSVLGSQTSAEDTFIMCVLPLYLSMVRKPE